MTSMIEPIRQLAMSSVAGLDGALHETSDEHPSYHVNLALTSIQ